MKATFKIYQAFKKKKIILLNMQTIPETEKKNYSLPHFKEINISLITKPDKESVQERKIKKTLVITIHKVFKSWI